MLKNSREHAADFVKRAGYKVGGEVGNNWISDAVKNPGALHRELHVPEGQKIPEDKIEKASHSKNKKLARRANLAKTLGKLHKK